MNKIILILVQALFVLFLLVKPAFSAEALAYLDSTKPDYLLKKLTIHTVLSKYGSPLAEEVDSFMRACITYKINCYLIPSISGVESTFGKNIPFNSYNAYGWENGDTRFASWESSIMIVAKTLKNNYLAKGFDTVERIAPIYAPPSTTWAKNVNYFMAKFEAAEKEASISAE